MAIKIEATGRSIAEALAAFGPPNLALLPTDELIAELRERLASEVPSRVLRILPFAEEKPKPKA